MSMKQVPRPSAAWVNSEVFGGDWRWWEVLLPSAFLYPGKLQNSKKQPFYCNVFWEGWLELPSLKLTASLHLKMDGWNTWLSFWDSPFWRDMLVSGRVLSLHGVSRLFVEKWLRSMIFFVQDGWDYLWNNPSWNIMMSCSIGGFWTWIWLWIVAGKSWKDRTSSQLF